MEGRGGEGSGGEGGGRGGEGTEGGLTPAPQAWTVQGRPGPKRPGLGRPWRPVSCPRSPGQGVGVPPVQGRSGGEGRTAGLPEAPRPSLRVPCAPPPAPVPAAPLRSPPIPTHVEEEEEGAGLGRLPADSGASFPLTPLREPPGEASRRAGAPGMGTPRGPWPLVWAVLQLGWWPGWLLGTRRGWGCGVGAGDVGSGLGMWGQGWGLGVRVGGYRDRARGYGVRAGGYEVRAEDMGSGLRAWSQGWMVQGQG